MWKICKNGCIVVIYACVVGVRGPLQSLGHLNSHRIKALNMLDVPFFSGHVLYMAISKRKTVNSYDTLKQTSFALSFNMSLCLTCSLGICVCVCVYFSSQHCVRATRATNRVIIIKRITAITVDANLMRNKL